MEKTALCVFWVLYVILYRQKSLGFNGGSISRMCCRSAHTDGRRTVVPVHRGEIIGPGLMLKILRDREIERDEFMKLAK